ncbi:PAS domain S-box-containing protein [Geosporobacter subterraneus DSM 17957]|uniref:PAS domain S-box-containing protein n=1 Tax=Geosporobacter subterraneus DSM 17957 TaxID=1121919 RepID=A0A1M6ETN6_9FIRM|nr:PAS domain-containing protein [Geosporobacter subterraneus]SHI88817.1 PAS domain S-box-containing protein [Geosporobacter subterraneus DSM 17957]
MDLKQFETYDLLPIPVFIVNGKGRLIYANKTVEEVYGYSPEEFTQLFLVDLGIDEEDGAVHQKVLEFSLKNKRKRRLVRQHKKKDGGIIDVDIQWSIVEYGGESYTISCIREITEQQEVLRTYERSVDLMAKIVQELSHCKEV